ncbi:MAG: response regulator, partial [Pseudomonadota bacterium]|nr:response regulator [Pseudomonadota bacterium]
PVNNSAEKKEKLSVAAPLALPDESKDGAVQVSNTPDKQPLQNKERVLRVSADQLNRLMGLAGESLVESRWIYPYAESLLRLKRQQTDLVCLVDSLREQVDSGGSCDDIQALVRSVQKQSSYCREILADRLAELESYDRRATNLSSRLHREVVKSRMRPFGDGIHGFPRMVRDVARGLGKEVQFVVDGAKTLVDRDILDKMESPLNHLIRNAIDHGMESPEERQASGKTTKGSIRLHAYHHAGMLSIVVEDNGRGVDLERLRRKVIEKGLVDEVMATTLSDSELLEFLFLPSFSTREQVSEISGRGVGLDVVHDVVQEMRGNVRAVSEFGKGTKFHMQLPLTLSVIPALIVEIAEESYAFPLARIDRIVRIDPDSIEEAEGNQFVRIDNMNVGLVNAAQILEREPRRDHDDGLLSVVVLTERASHYGMVVEKFLGERELVVQVMPAALGKVQDISAAALMEDGSPVLIVDVDDLIRSIEKVLKVARLSKIRDIVQTLGVAKRVLVVDDSITVREVERKLLEASGYAVDTAVDGVDGLNMLRGGGYDLLITDVDMPRMNGIDLVKTVRQDPGLRSLPVMMVSYKDREEDRIRGLDAGADYYLTKGSFHDESLRQAVIDLIGTASV